MKYKDDQLYRRRIGQPRKDNSIYTRLCHPYDLKNKEVIFIGKKEEPYCLTKGKKYKVIDARLDSQQFVWDKDLKEREKKEGYKRVCTDQTEEYFLIIINDKGHKRRYSSVMFELFKEEIDKNDDTNKI